LALEVPTAWGATENQRGNSRPDPASGTRKSRLGGAENPRRTLEARLRSLRKERGGTIFTPYRAAGRSGQDSSASCEIAPTSRLAGSAAPLQGMRRDSAALHLLVGFDVSLLAGDSRK
jgi:hypothetical protein